MFLMKTLLTLLCSFLSLQGAFGKDPRPLWRICVVNETGLAAAYFVEALIPVAVGAAAIAWELWSHVAGELLRPGHRDG
ncbi:hypothetical protein LX32DRAFT_633790, partial [Colletotrichum zoysiae]